MLRMLNFLILTLISQATIANDKGVFDQDTAKKTINIQLATLNDRPHTQWQYTEVNHRENGKKTEVFQAQYHPKKTNNGGWTLIAVNDQTPKKKQKKSFYKQKLKQQQDETSGSDQLSDIVNSNSLTFTKQQQDLAYFEFQPQFSDFSSEAEHVLIGELIYHWPTKQIKNIRIRNTSDFSPAISVKMSRFFIDFTVDFFQQSPFIKQTRLDIVGKIAGLKKLSIKNRSVLSDLAITN